MDFINSNPYRILGVLSNSSRKEIVANYSKIKAFLKTGKQLSFENDFNGILKPVVRNEETTANAYNAITLPKDRFLAGFFWFIESTDLDSNAIDHIRLGDIDKAIDVLRTKPTVSACINLALLHLIKKEYTTALYYYAYLLDVEEKRCELLSILTENTELFTEDETIRLFVDKLVACFPEVNWIQSLAQKQITVGKDILDIKDFFIKSNVYEYLKDKQTGVYIKKIEDCLHKASRINKKDAKSSLSSAILLEEKSKDLLRTLRVALGKDNRTFIELSDKVAVQTLDHCIDYYNNDKDNPQRAKVIIRLLRYAMRTAEGKVAKDRCKQNLEFIKSQCEKLLVDEIKDEVLYINRQISEFNKFYSISKSNYVGYLESSLYNCFQQLLIIKNKVGEEHILYIKESSKVINFAIDIVSAEIDHKVQEYKQLAVANRRAYSEIKNTFKWGKIILDSVKSLAKDVQTGERFNSFNLKFKDLFNQYTAGIEEAALEEPLMEEPCSIKVIAPKDVTLGGLFRIEFVIEGNKVESFVNPVFDGLTVVKGPNKEVQTECNKTIIRYSLIAKRAGVCSVSSTSCVVNGKKIISQPLQICSIYSDSGYSAFKKRQQENYKQSKGTDTHSKWRWWLFGFVAFCFLTLFIINVSNDSNNSNSSYKPESSTLGIKDKTSGRRVPKVPDIPKVPEVKTKTNAYTGSSATSNIGSYENRYITNPDLFTTPAYTTVNYNTGDKPYKSYYGNGRFDYDTENSLLIKNGSSSDAVVFLETLGGKKVRHVYICKGNNYRMKNIPAGRYIIKIYQGNSWNPEKANGADAPLGGFMQNVSMTKSSDYDPFDYPAPESGGYYDYEVTLYKVTNGNMHTTNINSSDMF